MHVGSQVTFSDGSTLTGSGGSSSSSSAFAVHVSASSHSGAQKVAFDTTSHETNTYSSGGLDAGTSQFVVLPVSGTYALSAFAQSGSGTVSLSLLSGSTSLHTAAASSSLSISGSFYIASGAQISLQSENSTSLTSASLVVTLLKPL